jgi:hypothetical protein
MPSRLCGSKQISSCFFYVLVFLMFKNKNHNPAVIGRCQQPPENKKPATSTLQALILTKTNY